jgi:predicted metal-binding membrane protein
MRLIWFLKGNLVVWAVNGVLFAVLGLSGFGWANLIVSGYFSKITFVETGVAFLVGGALAFSGSLLPNKAREQILKTADEPWSMEKLRRGEKRANKCIILALILFVESLLVAFAGL